MLENNRRSALVMSLVFTLVMLASRIAAEVLLGVPGGPAKSPEQSAQLMGLALFSAVAAVVFVLGFSRTNLVTELGALGFGWTGMANWTLLGLLTGVSTALFYRVLLFWPGKDNFWFDYLSPAGFILLFIAGYWLVFRRNPLTLPGKPVWRFELSQFFGWFLFLFGVLIVTVGASYMIYLPDPLVLKKIFGLLLGSVLLIFGLALLLKNHPRAQSGLLAAGILLAAAAAVLAVNLWVR